MLNTAQRIWLAVFTLYLSALAIVSIGPGLWRDAPWWLALAGELSIFFYVPALPLFVAALALRSRWATCLALIPFLVFVSLQGVAFGQGRLTSTSKQAIPLRVYSHNLATHASGFRAEEAQIDALAPDIFSAQELNGSAFELLDYASQRFPYAALAPKSSPAGVGIWSRYPILSSAVLNPVIGADFSERATLLVNGQTVAVYVVHLNPPWPGGFVGSLRTSSYLGRSVDFSTQKAQLAALLADLDSRTGPIILAGDFNSAMSSLVYRSLATRYEDSFMGGGMGLGFTFPAQTSRNVISRLIPPFLRLDYIWTTPGLGVHDAWVADSASSDHHAIVADLTLN